LTQCRKEKRELEFIRSINNTPINGFTSNNSIHPEIYPNSGSNLNLNFNFNSNYNSNDNNNSNPNISFIYHHRKQLSMFSPTKRQRTFDCITSENLESKKRNEQKSIIVNEIGELKKVLDSNLYINRSTDLRNYPFLNLSRLTSNSPSLKRKIQKSTILHSLVLKKEKV